MPRVLILHTIGFVLGIVIGNFFLVPVPAAFALALAALLFSLFVLLRSRDIRLLAVFTLCTGLLWGQINTLGDQDSLPAPGEPFHGVGVVETQPRPTSTGQIFSFALEQVNHHPVRQVRIHVLSSPEAEVHYGDVLAISGKMLDGAGATNPGQFDYDQYLKRRGIFGTVSTMYGGEIERTGENRGHGFIKAVVKIKTKMDLVLANLPSRQRAFIEGMLFGNKGDLTFSQRNVLSQTGLMDAFAVSGVHVGYVVLFTLYFAQIFRLNKWGRLIAVALTVVFYAALSEFTASVIRSGAMALLGLLAYSLGEKKDFFTGLALAALGLLIWHPEMVYDAGFQLSFAAAWGVVYLMPTVSGWFPQKPDWWKLFAATVAAQLAIMPLIVYYFNVFTFSGLIVGILSSPLVGGVVLLGLFSVALSVFSTWLAVLPAYGAGLLVEGIWQGAKLVAGLPGSYLTVKTPGLFFLFLFYSFLIGLPYLAKVKKGRIYSALATAMLLIYLVLPVPGSGYLTVTFLDVGQGDAIFVRSPSGRTCLIDGGGKPNQTGDQVGEQVVVPFLQNQGLGELDLMILTHPHDDHMKGLLTVVQELEADKLVVADAFLDCREIQPLLHLAAEKKVTVIPVYEGQEILFDQGVKFSVLSPGMGETPPEEDMNNYSLVMKLSYQDISFLLTGDAEMACLSSLADNEDIASDIMKLPHHGSKTSFLPGFYEMAAPQSVVISVGKNSFGHPSPEILAYWEEKGIPVYRTDQSGAIHFFTDGKALWMETFFH